jgi:hypothetical protein
MIPDLCVTTQALSLFVSFCWRMQQVDAEDGTGRDLVDS